MWLLNDPLISSRVSESPFDEQPQALHYKRAHTLKHAADQTRVKVGVEGALEWTKTVLSVNHEYKLSHENYITEIPILTYHSQQLKPILKRGWEWHALLQLLKLSYMHILGWLF